MGAGGETLRAMASPSTASPSVSESSDSMTSMRCSHSNWLVARPCRMSSSAAACECEDSELWWWWRLGGCTPLFACIAPGGGTPLHSETPPANTRRFITTTPLASHSASLRSTMAS